MTDVVELQGVKCRVLAEEIEGSRVAICVATYDEFQRLDVRQRARLVRIMQLWCAQQKLTKEQYNANEGRHKRDDLNVLLHAFKVRKIRLYGFTCTLEGRHTSLIVEIDSAKKQDRADPRLLARAGQSALDILGLLRKKK